MAEVKTAAQLAEEARQLDEVRRANQVEFDPKIHGAGTAPVQAPQSVTELFHYVVARFERLESSLSNRGGVPGPTGPMGPQGPAGPEGPAGKDGVDGKDASSNVND